MLIGTVFRPLVGSDYLSPGAIADISDSIENHVAETKKLSCAGNYMLIFCQIRVHGATKEQIKKKIKRKFAFINFIYIVPIEWFKYRTVILL